MNEVKLKRWLTILLVVVLAAMALLVGSFYKESLSWRKQDSANQKANESQVGSEEAIKRQLEQLKSPDDATRPSEEEIKRQLEQLKSPDDATQPTQEDMRNQLEELKKQ